MKHVKHISEKKQEPVAKAVTPAGAGQIGVMTGTARSVAPLYAGRGYEAPKAGTTIHPRGSQGKR